MKRLIGILAAVCMAVVFVSCGAVAGEPDSDNMQIRDGTPAPFLLNQSEEGQPEWFNIHETDHWESCKLQAQVIDLEGLSVNALNRILQQYLIGDRLYIQYYDTLPSSTSYLGQWDIHTGKQLQQMTLKSKSSIIYYNSRLYILEPNAIAEYSTTFERLNAIEYDPAVTQGWTSSPSLSADGTSILFSNKHHSPAMFTPSNEQVRVLDDIVLPDGRSANGGMSIYTTNHPDQVFVTTSVTDEGEVWNYTLLYDTVQKKTLSWLRQSYENPSPRAVYCSAQGGEIFTRPANNVSNDYTQSGLVLASLPEKSSASFNLHRQLTFLDLTQGKIYQAEFKSYTTSAEALAIAANEGQESFVCIVSDFAQGNHVNRIVVLEREHV